MIGKYIAPIFLTLLLHSVPALCQETTTHDSSTCQCGKEIGTLYLRIDSLEARMESLQIQVVESDPFKSAKYLQWGKGLTFAVSKSEPRISCDVGYTYCTPKSFRMGIAAGFEGEFGPETDLPRYGFYGKVSYGTPVFVNFISINTYARTLFYPENARWDYQQTSGGIGAGVDMEFWFTQEFCYTFGGSMTVMHRRDSFEPVTLGEVNFIGFKYTPRINRKKR